ncbi:MAG: purine-binding chemotaxis protein CheW [Bacteroidales bacterium]|nr:purine-binding chemotaxis protein CheW [Bacteroidales bacterium]
MSNSHLRFSLKNESFAVPVDHVLKILEFDSITPVPKAPPFFKGVLNWQGSLLPVIDLNLKLDFKETVITKESCILVLEIKIGSEKTNIGCIVDEVRSVIPIEADQIVSSPSIGEKYSSDLILGMYPIDDQFIVLLDFTAIFETDESVLISRSTFNEPDELTIT